jgi:serine/threonine protein kinase
MLKLLTCAQGHYWEEADANGSVAAPRVCPVCGKAADDAPLLDPSLAPCEEPEPPRDARPAAPLPLRDEKGRPVVAGYEILGDLGRGPTGVVHYRARQVLVNRPVRLEVVLAREDPGQLAWGSLRGEATALGRLSHPNIIHILEAGERDRQLFYNAVELVEATPLSSMLGKPLPWQQAVVLVETLARAMHHAHERGVLHRNLKPASILLQPVEPEEPRASLNALAHPPLCRLGDTLYLPRITDFGLARRPIEGEVADLDLQGEFPLYLSPEQAWGRAREIGPHTDVYALGAILFELVADRPLFCYETPLQTLEAVQCKEAPPPSRFIRRLSASVAGNLDAVCRKCLAKQPRRRYASALDLANDLRRLRTGYPVRARPTTTAVRARLWGRRHRTGLAMTLLALAAGISLLVAISSGNDSPPSRPDPRWPATQPRGNVWPGAPGMDEARQREARADYARRILLAERAITSDNPERARELLENCPVDLLGWEWACLQGRLRGEQASVFALTWPVAGLVFSPDGQYLAAGGGFEDARQKPSQGGEVFLRQLGGLGTVFHHEDLPHPVRALSFSPDSLRLAVLGSNGIGRRDSEVKVYEWHPGFGGSVAFTQTYGNVPLTSLAHTTNGSRLLMVGSNRLLFTLDAHSGDRPLNYPLEDTPPWQRIEGSYARVLTLHQPGDRFATVSPDGQRVRVHSGFRPPPWPIELRGHTRPVLALAEHGDTSRLATASRDGTARVWHTGDGRELAVLRGHKGAVTGVAFHPYGKRLATCGEDGTVRIWDAETGDELLALTGLARLAGVAFSPDGRLLAVAHGNKVTVWSGAANGRR